MQDAHSRPGVQDLLQHSFITAVLPAHQVRLDTLFLNQM